MTDQNDNAALSYPRGCSDNQLLMQAARLLSTGAFKVYVVLLVRSQSAKQPTWPSVSTLVVETGIPERTVSRHLREIKRAGLMRIERRLATSSVYHLAPSVGEPPPAAPSADAKSWEAEGVSRATYYRRRKKASRDVRLVTPPVAERVSEVRHETPPVARRETPPVADRRIKDEESKRGGARAREAAPAAPLPSFLDHKYGSESVAAQLIAWGDWTEETIAKTLKPSGFRWYEAVRAVEEYDSFRLADNRAQPGANPAPLKDLGHAIARAQKAIAKRSASEPPAVIGGPHPLRPLLSALEPAA